MFIFVILIEQAEEKKDSPRLPQRIKHINFGNGSYKNLFYYN